MPRFPQPGTVLLGKYRVDSLIGEGGMGAVIKAHHIDLDEFVAIKCLLPEMMERADIVQRFIREAKAAVKLKGEHVARVLDVGRLEDNVPYIVMEYLEGADLNAIIKHHGAQTPEVGVDLMLQACEAIAEAHSLGIIHRDIKASNFFITQQEGQAPVLKVLDFGIATAPEGASDLTSTQSVIGTPAYMAPEQMRSSRTADARSDIWSMGVVLYELLEGQRPFRSEVYSELCLKVGMDPPIPIENPDVSEPLRAIVMKCLEKPIERRYQSVAELAFDLMAFASDPVFARATVEQCARLLGRRAQKMFDGAVARSESDTTPMPNKPMRITPTSGQMAVAVPTSDAGLTPAPLAPIGRSSGAQPSLLGRPTPMPSSQPKTPTSIQRSNGQISIAPPTLKPRRHGLWIGVAVVALAGGAAFAMFGLGGGDSGSEVQPATPPAATPAEPGKTEAAKTEAAKTEPVKTEPVKPEPVKPELVKTEPVNTETADTEPVKTEPVKTEQIKPEPVKTEPVKTTKPPVRQIAAVKRPPVVVKTVPPKKKDPKDLKDPKAAEPGGELYIKRQ